MKKAIFKNALSILAIFSILIGLVGCSSKTTDQIIKYAKKTHGDCEVISKTEEDGISTVVFKDSLQGFEYKVTSSMSDISIDGTTIGSVEQQTDTFRMEAINYAAEQLKPELTGLCYKFDVTYEVDANVDMIKITLNNEGIDASLIAYECATIFKKYNVENRLDGLEFAFYHNEEWLENEYEKLRADENIDEYDTIFSSAGAAELSYIGSLTFPNGSFHYGEVEE